MPFYIDRPDGWVKGRVLTKTSTGWRRGWALYRKTAASTWTRVETYDTNPPGTPTLVSTSYDSTYKKVTVIAQMPADSDVQSAVLKYSYSAYPESALDKTYTTNSTDLIESKKTGPNSQVAWTWTVPSYDRDYYVSVWAVDDGPNPSNRLKLTVRCPSPTFSDRININPPDPVTTTSKMTYNCTDSGTWARQYNNWSSYYGDLLASNGEQNNVGVWTYNGKIAAALSKFARIDKMTIKIQRASSSHGVSGEADIYLIPHKLDVQGAEVDNDVIRAAEPVKVGTLSRGEIGTFNVPSQWWPYFLNGSYKGFGIWGPTGTSTYADPAYVNAYGKGTTSGQVYIEASGSRFYLA